MILPLSSLPQAHELALWRAYSAALRPSDPMDPSEFAARYRVLHAIYCSERPGAWSNDVFPYQRQIMDAGAEAIRTGKRGLVMMKSAQGGGTDCMINLLLWLKEYYPGPQLFMTSTEDIASEFGRERFALSIRDCPPLKKKYIARKKGDILVKRFLDGKISLCGGQSVFKLQSTPYRIVAIDELDSLSSNLGGQGDPVKMAENRTDAFGGATVMIAYAHPSTRERGAAKIYYESSDQRRGFVTCPHDECGHEFYFRWEDVVATPSSKAMTAAQAKANPACYDYYCPKCAQVITDADRVAMTRKVVYRSTLAPDEAAKKNWIGVHFSQLYYPNKTIRQLAERWIECGDDENAKMVFYNKTLGEPFEKTIKDITAEDFAPLIARECPEFRKNEIYHKGEVPPGVRFLTSGQDFNSEWMHWCVWGYGLARTTALATVLRRWLIDWGVVKRLEKSNIISPDELKIFDALIFNKQWPSSNGSHYYSLSEGALDSNWGGSGVLDYCREHPWRAFPCRGGAYTSLSKAELYREMKAPQHSLHGEKMDQSQNVIVFNTFKLKMEWYGLLNKKIEIFDQATGAPRHVPYITLPNDVDGEWIAQNSAESLTSEPISTRKMRKGEMHWKKNGANHWGDCTIYCDGMAQKINPFQEGLTFDEAEIAEQLEAERILKENQKAKTKIGNEVLDRYAVSDSWIK